MLYSLFSHSGFTNDIILTPSLANNTYLITFSPTYTCFLCSHIFYFWYYVGSSGLARDYCYSYLGAGDFARSTPQNVPSTLLHIPVKFGCYSQHTFLTTSEIQLFLQMLSLYNFFQLFILLSCHIPQCSHPTAQPMTKLSTAFVWSDKSEQPGRCSIFLHRNKQWAHFCLFVCLFRFVLWQYLLPLSSLNIFVSFLQS